MADRQESVLDINIRRAVDNIAYLERALAEASVNLEALQLLNNQEDN